MSLSTTDIRQGLQNVQLATFFPDTVIDSADITDIKVQCRNYIEKLGFQYFGYSAYYPSAKSNQNIFSFPTNWTSSETNSIITVESPISKACQCRTTPFFWERMHHDNDLKPDVVTEFLKNAAKHGVHDGLCVPVHGAGSEWGMLNVANNKPDTKSTLETIHTLQLFAATLHQAVKRACSNQLKQAVPDKSLSPRERECLTWIAAGKTAWETAQIIGITESTVAFHIRNTINKLNASNRAHAVAVGMARSLIGGPQYKD